MSKYKLKQLIREINERTTENNQYPALTSSQNGIVMQEDYFKKQIASNDNTGYKIIKKGQFTYRSMSDTGYFYINKLNNPEIGIISPAYPVFEIINDDIILNDFLEIFFSSDVFMEKAKKLAKGSTRYSLKYKQISEIEINVPEIKIQEEVIKNIYKIKNCIDLKTADKLEVEKLIESTFRSMFGDPEKNDKSFPTKSGTELFNFTSGKFLPAEGRKDSGYPVFGGNGINWYTDNYMIDFPTIVIGRVGAYCGNVRIAPEKSWITDNAIYIKEFKTNDFEIEFLHYLMKQNNLSAKASFSGQPKITQKPLNDYQYMIPPRELQKKFSSKVVTKEKLIEIIDNDIEDLKQLLNLKMDEYFN